MTTTRRAEIAGGGFGGLAAAVALLQRGWCVRVHERMPLPRAEGYGIAIHENGLRVLAALGVRDRVLASGLRIARLVSRDAADHTVADLPVRGSTYRLSRQAIVLALVDRLTELGGEFVTNSTVTSVTPDGSIETERGLRAQANLIVLADGIGSRLRDALPARASRRLLIDGALRLVVPRLPDEVAPGMANAAAVVEYWSGTRRLIYSPCGADQGYLALTCLHSDATGRAIPLDVPSWQSAFPHLAPLFDLIAVHADWERVFWQRFEIIRLKSWSAGCVALVGDAAHAMPPNLGQGAGCAMMNALGMAVALDESADVPVALGAWERRERPLTEHVQKWSGLYGRSTAWPQWLRSAFFAALGRSRWMKSQMDRAVQHIPTGT